MNVSEVQLLLAAPAATAGYVSPGSVYNSNGKYCSTTQLNTTTTLDNLFPDMTGPENANQQIDYQCLFVYNTDSTDTMTGITVWIPTTSVTSTALNWYVGVDPTGASPVSQSGTPQAVYISNPQIAPAGVTFAGPVAAATSGAAMASIPPGYVAALWIMRESIGYVDPNGNSVTSGFNVQVTFSVS